jgi:periplasmic divalent cation tolerance protein
MTDKRIVLSTAGDKQEAKDIAWALIERRQAACVNVVPIESVFRWKGEIEESPEFLLIIKTTASSFDQVAATIKELNTYKVAECLQLPLEAGAAEYLAWIGEAMGASGD